MRVLWAFFVLLAVFRRTPTAAARVRQRGFALLPTCPGLQAELQSSRNSPGAGSSISRIDEDGTIACSAMAVLQQENAALRAEVTKVRQIAR